MQQETKNEVMRKETIRLIYIIMCMTTAVTGCRRPVVQEGINMHRTTGTDGKTTTGEQFDIEIMNSYTPVKDQGLSPVCWAYAMLSAIETEHIMRGDSVHLSVKYAVRSMLEDNYRRCYLSHGAYDVTMRGTAGTLLGLLERHGVVPYDAYHDYGNGTDMTRHAEAYAEDSMTDNVDVTARKVERLAHKAIRTRAGLNRFDSRLKDIIDEALGPAPKRVFMLGAEYTPEEFARSVCAPGEYVALTSFTHHPFYTDFALEVPDNYEQRLFHNVPLDTLMAAIERAVRNGHGVCWEGDVSEEGFSFAEGTATLPSSAGTSQESRQRAFERFETTDDHCMAIVGIARDSRNRMFYIMKNSWGTDNPFGGMMYVSEDYVRMKTVAVYLSEEGRGKN